MKKLSLRTIFAATLGLAIAGTGAVLSVAPASASPTVTMSNTTNLYPGELVTYTVVDNGTLCDAAHAAGNWGLAIKIEDASGTVLVPHSFNYSGNTAAYTAVSGTTYTQTLETPWFSDGGDAVNGHYTVTVSCDVGGSDGAGVSSAPIPVTYRPVAVNKTTVPAGGNITLTAKDVDGTMEDGTWCGDGTGAGYSMAISLVPASGTTVYSPTGWDTTPMAGFGSFDPINVTATATAVIPATTPAGVYDLHVTCIDPGSGYGHSYRHDEIYHSITVTTTSSLANTGQDSRSLIALLASGFALLIAGSVLVLGFARRKTRA